MVNWYSISVEAGFNKFYYFLVGYKPEEPNDRQQTMYYTLWEMKDMEKRGLDKVCLDQVRSFLHLS